MDYFYYNIKNTSDYTSSKGKKKALIDYLENHFDLKIKREYYIDICNLQEYSKNMFSFQSANAQ